MCGICGAVQIGGEPGEIMSSAALDVMTDVMTHRGPDERGTFLAPGIALGVRRLAIVDVAHGQQPVFSEDGRVVAIQNGELYNHGELRRELERQGHMLSTRCDTEVLTHLYEEYDTGFASKLRGKFGIAVWDGSRRRAVLARDRMGVKPLYWARSGDLIVFASELKSLIASGMVDLALDVEAIDLYLNLGFIPGPRTPFTHVRKLAPGGVLLVDQDGVHESLYWSFPEPRPERKQRPVQEYADELMHLLREAVRDRLMSDVPLGAMLSGGLDSSLIVALMAEATDRPVMTFSVGFKEDPANELADARRVAEAFGCEHHELELTTSEEPIGLEELVWHLDEPVADLSALGFDVLSGLAAREVTVALAGQGADELFGGYDKHRAAARIQSLDVIPSRARRGLAALPWPNARLRRAFRAVAARDPSERLLAMSGRLLDGSRSELYRGELAAVPDGHSHAVIERARGGLVGDPLAVTLYLDAKLGLVDDMLLYFDRASMAHSLEVRVPFLDHRLVEWAATLPSSIKVGGGATKRVLKEAGSRVLPAQTVQKRKIGFFRYTLATWLDSQLDGEGGERLRSPDAAYRELLDAEAVGRLVDLYRRRPSEDRARLIFAVLVLEMWLTEFPARAARFKQGTPTV